MNKFLFKSFLIIILMFSNFAKASFLRENSEKTFQKICFSKDYKVQTDLNEAYYQLTELTD